MSIEEDVTRLRKRQRQLQKDLAGVHRYATRCYMGLCNLGTKRECTLECDVDGIAEKKRQAPPVFAATHSNYKDCCGCTRTLEAYVMAPYKQDFVMGKYLPWHTYMNYPYNYMHHRYNHTPASDDPNRGVNGYRSPPLHKSLRNPYAQPFQDGWGILNVPESVRHRMAAMHVGKSMYPLEPLRSSP